MTTKQATQPTTAQHPVTPVMPPAVPTTSQTVAWLQRTAPLIQRMATNEAYRKDVAQRLS